MTFEEAKKILIIRDAIDSDGTLYSLGWYVCWNGGEKSITLDGHFSVEELEAIVVYIQYQKEILKCREEYAAWLSFVK